VLYASLAVLSRATGTAHCLESRTHRRRLFSVDCGLMWSGWTVLQAALAGWTRATGTAHLLCYVAVAGTHDRSWGHTGSFDLRVDRGWVWSGRNVLQTALGGRVLREQCIGCAV
jgi:hypothetical protein